MACGDCRHEGVPSCKDNLTAALLRHAWWSVLWTQKLASGQVDPNDPNYDPDEDEPRRAPVALHAGHSEEMAAFKRAVRLVNAPGNFI